MADIRAILRRLAARVLTGDARTLHTQREAVLRLCAEWDVESGQYRAAGCSDIAHTLDVCRAELLHALGQRMPAPPRWLPMPSDRAELEQQHAADRLRTALGVTS